MGPETLERGQQHGKVLPWLDRPEVQHVRRRDTEPRQHVGIGPRRGLVGREALVVDAVRNDDDLALRREALDEALRGRLRRAR